jgi:hypothetical protein
MTPFVPKLVSSVPSDLIRASWILPLWLTLW